MFLLNFVCESAISKIWNLEVWNGSMEWFIWNDGMANMEWFQNLALFSCKTFLMKGTISHVLRQKPELVLKIQRIMGSFYVLEILYGA